MTISPNPPCSRFNRRARARLAYHFLDVAQEVNERQRYLDLDPDDVVRWAGDTIAVIDCFGILTDDKIRRYFELGCEVKALGRGHALEVQVVGGEVAAFGHQHAQAAAHHRGHGRAAHTLGAALG